MAQKEACLLQIFAVMKHGKARKRSENLSICICRKSWGMRVQRECRSCSFFSDTVARGPRQVMVADEAATFPCLQGMWATCQPACIAFTVVQLCTLHQILLEDLWTVIACPCLSMCKFCRRNGSVLLDVTLLSAAFKSLSTAMRLKWWQLGDCLASSMAGVVL